MLPAIALDLPLIFAELARALSSMHLPDHAADYLFVAKPVDPNHD